MRSILLFFVAFMLSCSSTPPSESPQKASNEASSYDKQAQQLFDDIFEEWVAESPEYLTYLGRKDRYDEWDDISEAAQKKELIQLKSQLARLKSIDPDRLSAPTQLNWQLLTQDIERDIRNNQWRHHDYPVNQMFGEHSGMPSLLISAHSIDKPSDAVAYIARLKGISKKVDQLITQLEIRKQKGVIAPKFVFPFVIDDSKNLIKGAPFDQTGEDSALWADFKRKTEKLDNQTELLAKAEIALKSSVAPAYERLITYLSELSKSAEGNHGAWSLPNGNDYYRARLALMTTTDMTADEIHQMGLDGINAIHGEIKEIMRKVEFKGTLQEFFVFMRESPQFYLDNSQEGRAAYLSQTRDYISAMKAALPQLFATLPKADLEVKAVEAFREKSAGKAFYRRPAADGSRPGMYYVNLYEMKDMPTYSMEALAYHEALPGHHMQIAINQEIEGAPKFRRYGFSYTAYVEGWGLYSEKVPKEIGFYSDPYSDFGRLSMELWRAARLVVDTGLHAKRWTREQAIKYLIENTPNTPRDCARAIERYMVMPGQATAYYVGMDAILKLRSKAKEVLGDKFDIREFHDVILANGSVPLNILANSVNQWIKSKG